MRKGPLVLLMAAFLLFAVSACGGGKQATERTIPEGGGVILTAGKYASQEFEPSFSFNLTKGWQHPIETKDTISLEAPKKFRFAFLEFHQVQRVYKVISSYEAKGQPAPKDLVSWLRNHPRLDTEKPKPITVAGEKGMQIDAVASRVPQDYYDSGCNEVCLPLFQPPSNPSASMSMYEDQKGRFIVLEDVEGKTVAITSVASEEDFDEFVSETQEAVDSVEWEGS